jgi:hypothetical protein
MSGPSTSTADQRTQAHPRQSTGSAGGDLERDADEDVESSRLSHDVPTKGDYRLLIEEPVEFSDQTLTSGGTEAALNRILNGPALSVFSYCAASILMTIVNKVGTARPVPRGSLWVSPKAFFSFSSTLFPFRTVCSIWSAILDEFPATLYPIGCLHRLCLSMQVGRPCRIPRLQLVSRTPMAPHLCPPRRCHLHRKQVSGSSRAPSYP